MTAQREEFDSPLTNHNQRRRQMEASMLEYSQRVRKLNSYTRSSNAYRYNGTLRGRDDPRYMAGSVTHRDYGDQDKKRSSLKYSRQQRPQSFDEKELQSNQQYQLSKQRPKRDTKSERPPVVVPSNMPPISNLPLLPHYGPSSTDIEVANRQRQIRINLVNAADLYDLVDLRLQEKRADRPEPVAKVANPEDGVRVIEDMHWAKPRKKNVPLDTFYGVGKSGEKSDRNGATDQRAHFLVGRSIKNEFVNPKVKTTKSVKDRPKHDDVYVLDKDHQKGRVLYRNEPDTKSNSPDTERVLDVFLEQAASNHRAAKALKHRPRRAKRMQLHKPDLMAIPEDTGSFVRSQESASDTARKDMLSSITVPYPTSSSLSAIRDVGSRGKHCDHRGPDDRTASPGAPSRLPTPDFQQKGSNDHNSDGLLMKRTPRRLKSLRDAELRSSRETADLDSVLVTSIYSGIPIDPHTDHNLRLRHVTLDRTSHKERAHKKMKRLIFLRDQPEQNYKREF